MISKCRIVITASVVALGIAVHVPGAAYAQQQSVQATPAASQAQGDQGYDLSFTLPTAGKSGCMVCHGDENLVRLKGDQFVSYWVDGAILDASAHAAVMCTGCHLDFAYKAPHNVAEEDWRRTARLACKNCHQEQFQAYSRGVHSISTTPGASAPANIEDKPLCGDCHGGHEIAMLTDNPAGAAALHERGFDVCGKCHEEYWDSYSDYYHGRAYRRGARDAPACWQCHGGHEVFNSEDRRSMVSESRLPDTCGQCHPTANEAYVSYSGLIHRRSEALEENPLYRLLNNARGAVAGVFSQIASIFS